MDNSALETCSMVLIQTCYLFECTLSLCTMMSFLSASQTQKCQFLSMTQHEYLICLITEQMAYDLINTRRDHLIMSGRL